MKDEERKQKQEVGVAIAMMFVFIFGLLMFLNASGLVKLNNNHIARAENLNSKEAAGIEQKAQIAAGTNPQEFACFDTNTNQWISLVKPPFVADGMQLSQGLLWIWHGKTVLWHDWTCDATVANQAWGSQVQVPINVKYLSYNNAAPGVLDVPYMWDNGQDRILISDGKKIYFIWGGGYTNINAWVDITPPTLEAPIKKVGLTMGTHYYVDENDSVWAYLRDDGKVIFNCAPTPGCGHSWKKITDGPTIKSALGLPTGSTIINYALGESHTHAYGFTDFLSFVYVKTPTDVREYTYHPLHYTDPSCSKIGFVWICTGPTASITNNYSFTLLYSIPYNATPPRVIGAADIYYNGMLASQQNSDMTSTIYRNWRNFGDPFINVGYQWPTWQTFPSHVGGYIQDMGGALVSGDPNAQPSIYALYINKNDFNNYFPQVQVTNTNLARPSFSFNYDPYRPSDYTFDIKYAVVPKGTAAPNLDHINSLPTMTGSWSSAKAYDQDLAPGDYTIYFKAFGPADDLGLSFESGQAIQDFTMAAAPPPPAGAAGVIHPQQSTADVLKYTGAGSASFELLNGVASISLDGSNWYSANGEVLARAQGITDLSITKNPSEQSKERGDSVQFSVLVKNSSPPGGTGATVNAQFIEKVPAGLRLVGVKDELNVSWSIPQYTMEGTYKVYKWTVPGLQVNQQKLFTIDMQVTQDASGPQRNKVEIWKENESAVSNSEKSFNIAGQPGDVNNTASAIVRVPVHGVYPTNRPLDTFTKTDNKEYVRTDGENIYLINFVPVDTAAKIIAMKADALAAVRAANPDMTILDDYPIKLDPLTNIILADNLPVTQTDYVSSRAIPGQCAQVPSISQAGNILGFNWPSYNIEAVGATPNQPNPCALELKVNVKADLFRRVNDTTTTTIVNPLSFTSDQTPTPQQVSDTSKVAAPFAQEPADRGQGDIYAKQKIGFKKNLPIGSLNALYVIGAQGTLDAETGAKWTASSYTLRGDSPANFDPAVASFCDPSYAFDASGNIKSTINPATGKSVYREYLENLTNGYCIMKRNTERLKTIADLTRSGDAMGSYTSDQILNFTTPAPTRPEGKVIWVKGDLNLKSPTGKLTVRGRGTIIVEGNLRIYSGMEYNNPQTDVVGFIVLKNSAAPGSGNVSIEPVVGLWGDICTLAPTKPVEDQSKSALGKTVGIFYVPDGTFWSRANDSDGQLPAGRNYDNQFYLYGAIVAKTFMLQRNFVGVIDAASGKFCSEIQSGAEPTDPGELFDYDSRILTNPPPGFTGAINK